MPTDCERPDCPRHLVNEIEDMERRLQSMERALIDFTARFETMTKMTQFIAVAVCAALGIDVSGGM